MRLPVLKKEKGDWTARSVEGNDLQEPEQHVAEIERLIAGYPKATVEAARATAPPVVPKD